MVNHNNQAGRLHKILTTAIDQPDGLPTIHVWANVFNIDQEDKSSVFRMLILLQETTDDIKIKISSLSDVNSKLLLSLHTNIEYVVKATNLDASWASYKPQLNLAVMLNLAHCAEALSRYDEKPIEANELTSLYDEITGLFNKVADGTVDPTLRDILLDLLEAIRRSITEYQIRGASGIRDQLAYCLGKVIQNEKVLMGKNESDEMTLFWKIFGRANNMTTVALNVTQISHQIMQLLTHTPR